MRLHVVNSLNVDRFEFVRTGASGIDNHVMTSNNDKKAYDMQGRRLRLSSAAPRRTLVVKQGKKTIVR